MTPGFGTALALAGGPRNRVRNVGYLKSIAFEPLQEAMEALNNLEKTMSTEYTV